MPSTFVKIPEIQPHWSRDRKIQTLMPIALQISKKRDLHPGLTSLTSEDLYQIASIAIVRAVDEYDPTRSPNIIAYVRDRINWAVLESIRENNHASRSMLSKGQTISWTQFSQPTKESDKNIGDVISETMVGDSSIDLNDMVYKKMICDKIKECINKLPPKHRDLLTYYLENGCTQREAAEHAGVSESSAFQIIKKSLVHIRKTLESQQIFEGALPI